MSRGSGPMSAPRGERPTIRDALLLIAGAAFGLWLVTPAWREARNGTDDWLRVLAFVLGGVSCVGPPMLLWRRIRLRARLELGELLWFCLGTASWLLWPGAVFVRLKGSSMSNVMSMICFTYVSGLMALFATVTLFASGYQVVRPNRSWRETLGLLLCGAWSALGAYLLYGIYRSDFR